MQYSLQTLNNIITTRLKGKDMWSKPYKPPHTGTHNNHNKFGANFRQTQPHFHKLLEREVNTKRKSQ